MKFPEIIVILFSSYAEKEDYRKSCTGEIIKGADLFISDGVWKKLAVVYDYESAVRGLIGYNIKGFITEYWSTDRIPADQFSDVMGFIRSRIRL